MNTESTALGVDEPPATLRTPAPFIQKLYSLLEDESGQKFCSFTAGGRSFTIWDATGFSRDVIPRYFRHNNFSSFIRQLNQYGFQKMRSDKWEFAQKDFRQGDFHRLKFISRRSLRNQPQQEQQHSPQSTKHNRQPIPLPPPQSSSGFKQQEAARGISRVPPSREQRCSNLIRDVTDVRARRVAGSSGGTYARSESESINLRPLYALGPPQAGSSMEDPVATEGDANRRKLRRARSFTADEIEE